jgi:hypothetical protein
MTGLASRRRAERYERILLVVAWIVFAAVTLVVTLHHEPWGDEADAWLAARDMSLGQLFHWFRYVGNPGLWYVLLMVPAKLGLPYLSMSILNWGLAVAVAGVVLMRAPFQWWVRCMLAFSYYLSYEYAVIARGYALMALLMVLIALWFERRFQRPVLMGLLIALLANTNVHGGLIAGVVFAAVAGEALLKLLRGEGLPGGSAAGWILVVGALVAVGGGLVALFSLFPVPADGQLSSFTRILNPHAAGFVLTRTFMPRIPFAYHTFHDLQRESAWYMPALYVGLRAVGLAILAMVIYLLRRRRQLLFIFLTVLGGMMYVFVFKWMGGVRHTGLVWLLTLFVLWIAKRQSDLEENDPPAWEMPRAAGALLVMTLVVSCATGILWQVRDWRLAFSGSRETAGFLIDHGLGEKRIAAYEDTFCTALLPYLPKERFWYVGREDYGTFQLWDRKMVANMDLSADQVVSRVASAFGDHRDLYLILNKPLPDPNAVGYELLFHDQRALISDPGAEEIFNQEHYFVYQRILQWTQRR